ncbi:MAG: response regulator, partial [Vicinamibacterales bacterium]
VLIVDDNIDAAELLAEMLANMGCVVRAVHDGPTALKAAAALRPDVALLDIGLPVMDGYELARRLAHEPGMAGLRLVAVTGYGQRQDRETSAQAGFHAHFVKPIDATQLRDLLTQLVPAASSPAEVPAALAPAVPPPAPPADVEARVRERDAGTA